MCLKELKHLNISMQIQCKLRLLQRKLLKAGYSVWLTKTSKRASKSHQDFVVGFSRAALLETC